MKRYEIAKVLGYYFKGHCLFDGTISKLFE